MMMILGNNKQRRNKVFSLSKSRGGILRTVLFVFLVVHMICFPPFTTTFNYTNNNYDDNTITSFHHGYTTTTTTTAAATRITMINHNNIPSQHTTTTTYDDNDNNDDDFSFINYNVTGDMNMNMNSTHILKISTYDDLLEVLDLYDQPHYCGYFKCYYATKNSRKNNSRKNSRKNSQSQNGSNNKRNTRNNNNQNEIGLFVTQGETWLQQRHLHDLKKKNNNRTYYDVLYESYLFSKQVVQEYPGIRSILAGPPIQLIDKPTTKHLHTLNYHNNEYFWKQYGNYPTQRIYDNSQSVIIQEVHKLPGSLYETYFEIRLTSGPEIIKNILMNDIINRTIWEEEAAKNTTTTTTTTKTKTKTTKTKTMSKKYIIILKKKLRSFIDTFVYDINVVKDVIMKYPIFSEDFQFIIDLYGKIYQTDWDRIFFVYNWSNWSYNNLTNTNNHTKMKEYVITYIDEMITTCNEIYYNVTNTTNNNTNITIIT